MEVAPEVSALLKMREPTRVVVTVRRKSPLWQVASSTPEKVIEQAVSVLQKKTDNARFLIHEKWDRHIFMVFDLFHTSYQPANGHHCEDLPVVLMFYTNRADRAYMAPLFHRNDTNEQVSEHHNLNGWDREPPYFADHTFSSVPRYPNPRDLKLEKGGLVDAPLRDIQCFTSGTSLHP
ncbi:MAG: hypothetical protein M1814_002644 [Vezdaea aestivalis]|nr:MAG: hypothetical protein M1814_002644 [Vezdaea aestivalis]